MYQPVPAGDLAAWCRRWLGAAPASVLFDGGYLSAVVGVQLADGRAVVVRSREPAARLAACVQVQRQLHAAGLPCPEPLAGPAPSMSPTIGTASPPGRRRQSWASRRPVSSRPYPMPRPLRSRPPSSMLTCRRAGVPGAPTSAGLAGRRGWGCGYDAKEEFVIHDDRAILARLAGEPDERLRLAGA